MDNVPRAVIGKLTAHERRDVVIRYIHLEAVLDAVHNGVVAHQNIRGKCLIDDSGNNLQLVFTALNIAIHKRIALAGKGQRHFAVHLHLAHRVRVVALCKRNIVIDRNAAERIHNAGKAGEIEAEVVINIRIIQHFERAYGNVHAVNTRMCQLIRDTARNRQRHIVVARGRHKQNLARFRIDCRQNVYIAAADRVKALARIAAADIQGVNTIFRIAVAGALRLFRFALYRRFHVQHFKLANFAFYIGVFIELRHNVEVCSI